MKNLLAFLSFRLRQRLVPLALLTFALGLLLAAIPGLLGCPSWWWLRWTVLLEPAWFLYDLFTFNTEPYTWLLHLFCVLVWLVFGVWLVQVVVVFREDRGDFYEPPERPTPLKEGEDLPPPHHPVPWARLLLPPVLAALLVGLMLADVPLRVSFRLHRTALDTLAQESLEQARALQVNPQNSAEASMHWHLSEPRWVGLYPIRSVHVNTLEGSVYTETLYDHANSSRSRDPKRPTGVNAGFIFKGKPREGVPRTHCSCQLDGDWQAYRDGGGRAALEPYLP